MVVSVTDTGPGIEPDERELIFAEFHRSSRSAQRGRGGLGLGLAIARQLIELHGGGSRSRRLVAAATARGSGSRCRTAPAMSSGHRTRNGRRDRGGGGRGNRCHRFSGLGRARARPCPTASRPWLPGRRRAGRATAADGCRPHRPSAGAIIVDGLLASGPAWELAQLLRREPGGADVPVLAYRIQNEGRGAVLELNYLSKPLRPSVLAEELIRQIGPVAGARTPRAGGRRRSRYARAPRPHRGGGRRRAVRARRVARPSRSSARHDPTWCCWISMPDGRVRGARRDACANGDP